MKILVTGGAGYIGSVASYILLQKGYQVVIVDNFSTGHEEILKKLKGMYSDRLTYYEIDLRDKVKLMECFEKQGHFDAVFHYAASCQVNESMENPYKYFENNIFGSLNLLENMRLKKINKLIFSSTCAVYGHTQYVPVDEEHPINPSNPYGESKAMVENVIKWYGRIYGLKWVVLRYFNVCGASDDGIVGDAKEPSVLLVQNAVRGALGIEPFVLTCPVVDTPDGTPIRDYINVVDLNEAHVKALEYLENGGESDIFNLGTGNGNSVLEIIAKVEKILGKEIKRNRGKERKGEYAKIYANIEKAKKVINWEPERSLEDSINSLVKWYTGK